MEKTNEERSIRSLAEFTRCVRNLVNTSDRLDAGSPGLGMVAPLHPLEEDPGCVTCHDKGYITYEDEDGERLKVSCPCGQ